jgi:hypothetical protein
MQVRSPCSVGRSWAGAGINAKGKGSGDVKALPIRVKSRA